MRGLLLTCLSVVMLSGGAAAETTALNLTEGDSVLLPPVGSISQPSLSRADASDTKSAAVTFNLGGHFSTQLEGAAISTPSDHQITNLPTSGNTAATSLMLNGLYEISNGSWHLKPFLGGGYGMVDANSRVLGQRSEEHTSELQSR